MTWRMLELRGAAEWIAWRCVTLTVVGATGVLKDVDVIRDIYHVINLILPGTNSPNF